MSLYSHLMSPEVSLCSPQLSRTQLTFLLSFFHLTLLFDDIYSSLSSQSSSLNIVSEFAPTPFHSSSKNLSIHSSTNASSASTLLISSGTTTPALMSFPNAYVCYIPQGSYWFVITPPSRCPISSSNSGFTLSLAHDLLDNTTIRYTFQDSSLVPKSSTTILHALFLMRLLLLLLTVCLTLIMFIPCREGLTLTYSCSYYLYSFT